MQSPTRNRSLYPLHTVVKIGNRCVHVDAAAEAVVNKFEKLWPYPKEIQHLGEEFAMPNDILVLGEAPFPLFHDDLRFFGINADGNPNDYKLSLSIDPEIEGPDGYHLSVQKDRTEIVGSSNAGLANGAQTFLQILAIYSGTGDLPVLTIKDHPTYKKRCFMLDLGRSVFNMPTLKRIIRMLARLKMNQLHLHLYDDPLCGIRFEGLPFGHDNPYSISIRDLGELVSYAAEYNVEIVPELEGWAHVTSIVYHYPHLRGGDGAYKGSSFLICEEMFALMKNMTRQVVEVMPNEATIHFGLDEAQWHVSKEMPEGYSPEDLLHRYYDMLQELAAESGKKLAMRIWADHGGRPVPQEIQHNTIIEPWQYWDENTGLIDKQIEQYSGEGKMRFMMGAGQSNAQHRGAFHATRYWCTHALNSPNVDGVNITFWGINDLAPKLITLFSGAHYAWNPESPMKWAYSEDYETVDHFMFPVMHWWQSNFRDAYPDEIQKDSAPYVYFGYYMWGDKHGQPVCPAAQMADTLFEHNFLIPGRSKDNTHVGLPD
jgi:hypothetical protein